MGNTWTAEQVLALAPDESSKKTGRDLAAPRKWVSLGHDERSAWGLCQGSGKDPYQTQIDLDEPAFHCTCPSRKFPCKHSLGIFLLLAGQPGALTEPTAPDWVKDWLAGREKRAEQQAARAAHKEECGEAVTDASAQAKRAADRQARVAAGLQHLETWLGDLARAGLASAQGRPYSFWEEPAKRLVDAQAAGVARLVKALAGIPSSGEGWQERLLARMGRLHLLVEGFRRLDSLPPETQADIRSLVGWTQSQEELLSEAGLADGWLVLGQRVEEEDGLRTQRTWLWGRGSRRAALVLSFAYGTTTPLDTSLMPGTLVEGELVFFPGAYPLRALVKARQGQPAPMEEVPGYATLAAAMEARASALAANPWLERFPVSLPAVVPVRRGDGWGLRDTPGGLLPLDPGFGRGWELLALSGGHPIALFAEWGEEAPLPLSAWVDGRFHLLT